MTIMISMVLSLIQQFYKSVRIWWWRLRFPKPIASREKIYRLGVLGRKGGGKTCLLGALGISQNSLAEGAEATRIRSMPIVNRLPDNAPDDHPLKRFQFGKNWLDDAERLLREGESPLPSPTTHPISGMYQFGNSKGRTWHVELVDYSGELLEAEQPPERFMATLRQYLHSLDAMLILVDAPAPEERAQFDGRLRRLREAFALIAAEQKKAQRHYDIPIALVFNKWDLRSDLSQDPATIERELLAFLQESTDASAHRDFIQTLLSIKSREGDDRLWPEIIVSNSATDEFRCFAASAFGPSRQQGTKYLPLAANPLKSFQIKAPFVWACERRDEVDLRQFEEKVRRRCCYNPAQWFDTIELLRQGFGIVHRFKRGTTSFARSRAALWLAAKAACNLLAVTVAVLLIFWLGTECTLDAVRYRHAQAVLSNSKADDAQIKEAEDWFEKYNVSPWWRHALYQVRLSKDQAIAELKAKRQAREDELFQTVTTAAQGDDLRLVLERTSRFKERFPKSLRAEEIDRLILDSEAKERKQNAAAAFKAVEDAAKVGELQTASGLAVKFLADFPDSEHAPNANRIVASAAAEKEKALRANEDEVRKREALLARIHDLETARAAEAAMNAPLPYPFYADKLLIERSAKLQQAARAAVKQQADMASELAREQDWQKVQKGVRDSINVRHYDAAARKFDETALVPANDEETKRLDELRKEITDNAITYFSEQVIIAKRDERWPSTHLALRTVTTDQFFKKIATTTQLDRLVELQKQLDEHWESALWQKVLDAKERKPVIREYLRVAPLKKFQDDANGYLEYLEKMDSKLDLKIVVTGKWGNTSIYSSSILDGEATFTVNNEEAQVLSVKIPDEKEGDVGEITWSGKLADTIKVSIEVKSGSHIVGKTMEEASLAIKELIVGQDVPLDRNNNVLLFKLNPKCLPQEPKLGDVQ